MSLLARTCAGRSAIRNGLDSPGPPALDEDFLGQFLAGAALNQESSRKITGNGMTYSRCRRKRERARSDPLRALPSCSNRRFPWSFDLRSGCQRVQRISLMFGAVRNRGSHWLPRRACQPGSTLLSPPWRVFRNKLLICATHASCGGASSSEALRSFHRSEDISCGHDISKRFKAADAPFLDWTNCKAHGASRCRGAFGTCAGAIKAGKRVVGREAELAFYRDVP